MQKPWIAATVGKGSSAIRWKTCWPRRMASLTLPLASNSANSLMSAPAMKPLALAERITMPFGGSSARRSSTLSSSISTACAKVLTELPARSNDSTMTPSSRCSSFQCCKRRPSRPAIMRDHPSKQWGCVRTGCRPSRPVHGPMIQSLFRRRQTVWSDHDRWRLRRMVRAPINERMNELLPGRAVPRFGPAELTGVPAR